MLPIFFKAQAFQSSSHFLKLVHLDHCAHSLKTSPFPSKNMGIFRLHSLVANAKQMIKLNHRQQLDVPKGYLAVYVGEVQKRRFVIPLSYLNQPLFQDLLHRSEEEFGFYHAMGGLTIPCQEDAFVDLTARLHTS
ncbi:Auxin responsive SAUR protein [Cynara cardunculus var. scolymus]|uniref:Auxin responsive SAUR protein n=1 Tax=Cynara cardunculus var. scolymus TaxID=59895 RepID=A0A118JXJ9_CYNCS|nr:Auxin responsive SAUR protein [Cynara cardunculus var. scolymus]